MAKSKASARKHAERALARWMDDEWCLARGLPWNSGPAMKSFLRVVEDEIRAALLGAGVPEEPGQRVRFAGKRLTRRSLPKRAGGVSNAKRGRGR